MRVGQPKLSEMKRQEGWVLVPPTKSQHDAKPEGDDYGMKVITTFKVAGAAYPHPVIC
jgi:hypothetical protein